MIAVIRNETTYIIYVTTGAISISKYNDNDCLKIFLLKNQNVDKNHILTENCFFSPKHDNIRTYTISSSRVAKSESRVQSHGSKVSYPDPGSLDPINKVCIFSAIIYRDNFGSCFISLARI